MVQLAFFCSLDRLDPLLALVHDHLQLSSSSLQFFEYLSPPHLKLNNLIFQLLNLPLLDLMCTRQF